MLLQRLKTGALFEFSCEAGAILGQAGKENRDRMRSFAQDFGLAFQITDDLLDVTSTAEKTGKAVGKDKDQGKATLISIYGIDGAKAEARKLVARANATLAQYGDKAAELQALTTYLLDRES
jgi:farnesyl diphosphate synthase